MAGVSGDAPPKDPLASGPADLDLDLLEELKRLTPAERLARHEGALELVRALRRAGESHYGFDPRAVASPDGGER
jgi:hypothetical protein